MLAPYLFLAFFFLVGFSLLFFELLLLVRAAFHARQKSLNPSTPSPCPSPTGAYGRQDLRPQVRDFTGIAAWGALRTRFSQGRKVDEKLTNKAMRKRAMNSTVARKVASKSLGESGSQSQNIGVIKARSKKQKAQNEMQSKKVSSRMIKNHMKYIVPQMKLALIREPGPEPIAITSADSIGQFVEPLRHSSEEYFIAFHLDSKLRVIGFCEVSHGTLSASLVHSREVFKAAILNNSYAIIVAHNHPSGVEDASKEDIETTKRLIAGGELLGVQVIDHVIVTAASLYSLRENYSHLWF